MKKTTLEYFTQLIAEAMRIGIEKMSIYGTSWTSYRPGCLTRESELWLSKKPNKTKLEKVFPPTSKKL